MSKAFSEFDRIRLFDSTGLMGFSVPPYAADTDSQAGAIEYFRLWSNDKAASWIGAADVTGGAGNVDQANDAEIGDTLNGVVLTALTRVLFRSQTDPIENGLFLPNASGAPTRVADWDNDTEINTDNVIFVYDGTVDAGTAWQVDSTEPHVPGVDEITFSAYVEPAGGGAAALDDLSDVDLTVAPTDLQGLIFDAGSGTFKAGDIEAGGGGAGGGSATVIAKSTAHPVTFNGDYAEFDLPAGEDYWEFHLNRATFQAALTDDFLFIQVSEAAVWQTGATYYNYTRRGYDNNDATADAAGDNVAGIIFGDTDDANDAETALIGVVKVWRVGDKMQWQAHINGSEASVTGSCFTKGSTAAPDGIRFFAGSGGVASGQDWTVDATQWEVWTEQAVGGGEGNTLGSEEFSGVTETAGISVAGIAATSGLEIEVFDGSISGGPHTFKMEYSTDNGVSWKQGASDYSYNGFHVYSGTYADFQDLTISAAYLSIPTGSSASNFGADAGFRATVRMNNPNDVEFIGISDASGKASGGNSVTATTTSWYAGAGVVTDIRLVTGAGTMTGRWAVKEKPLIETGGAAGAAAATKVIIAGFTDQAIDITPGKILPYDVRVLDADNDIDITTNVGRITPTGYPTGSFLKFTVKGRYFNASSDNYLFHYLYKNGVAIGALDSREIGTTSPAYHGVLDLGAMDIEHTDTDYYEVQGQLQADSGTTDIQGDETYVIVELSDYVPD